MVKKGFSLIETLVVMAVLAMFFACAAKVATVKPKPKIVEVAHGYYECYYEGEKPYEHYVLNNIDTPAEAVSACKFSPPVGAAFFNINTFGKDVDLFTASEPSITQDLSIRFAVNQFGLKGNEKTFVLRANINKEDSKAVETHNQMLKTLYPNSKINNSNGTPKKGILISW